MIPKKIHYFWFGKNKIGALSEKCLKSWSEKMPDYEINLWNEDNLPKDAWLSWEYIGQKKFAFASDYARYYILYHHGGIYFDTDVEAVKSFDNLLENKCFLGYEESNRLNSAVVGAEKGSKFVEVCMELMESNYRQKKPFLIAPELANQASVLTEDVTKYPEEYFYPYNPYCDTQDVKQLMFQDITSNTFSIHHWEKKWKMSFLSKLKRTFVK